jgi:hypothetical protein
MKLGKMNNKTLFALFASAAALLLTASVYQNTIASTTKPQEIAIDFNVFPAQDVIEVSKGESVKVPIMVEAPVGAGHALKLSVFADYMSPGGQEPPEAASVGLDKASVVLSSLGTPITEIGDGRIQRATGAFLTISAPADAAEGSYSYVLEARKELSAEEGLAAGKVFTVNIK